MDEIRFVFALLMNAAVLACAYAFARRWGGGGHLQATCDALLGAYVVQYLAVALPGVAGVLNLSTMTTVAAALCAALWLGARQVVTTTTTTDGADLPSERQSVPTVPSPFSRRPKGRAGASEATGGARPDSQDATIRPIRADTSLPARERLAFVACALFVVGYVGAYGWTQRFTPPLSTDPLVYHLPAAVQWMQTGRLGLFDTWYWNPAATYSPATSSTFMAWLVVPLRSDVLVRYVQVAPLLMIFLLVARLARLLGCGLAVAGLVAVAAALCRPFFSQVLFAKDDLFVTAFFGAAVVALVGGNPRDRLGPWRAGLAMGMVLSSKYTILLACPLFLFLVDAPFRARWRARDWAVAAGLALALSVPWYVRTTWLTGNPLYPVDVKLFGRTIFAGMFTTERDASLRTASGVWAMLSATYHSMPLAPLAGLAAGWIGGIAGAGRAAWRDPLKRTCLVGVPLTLVLFRFASPHHEVRYVFPLFLLLFATAGWALERWVTARAARLGLAGLFAAVSVATSFEAGLAAQVALLAATAAGVAIAGVAGWAFHARLAARSPETATRVLTLGGATAALVAALAFYTLWPDYRGTYRGTQGYIWAAFYPAHVDLWTHARDELPPDATIAFANTSFVYPLYDFDFTRRVVHAPVRRGLTRFLDVPRLGETIPGDDIVIAMTATQNADADRDTWLRNLDALGVEYLVVHKSELGTDPPELRMARAEPARFQVVFETGDGVIYRVARGG